MGDAEGRRVSARLLVAVRAVAAVVAVVALGACQVDLSVEVDAKAGGGGSVRATVTLDEEAAAQVDDLARELRVEDLEQAGWVVDGPSPAGGGGGGVTVRASKRFTSPAGAARAVEELSGSGGPFSTLRLTRERGRWRTRTALRGTVDLSAGLGAFADPGLTDKLGAPGLGLDRAALERELGRPLAETVAAELVGRLPGRVTSNAPRSRAGAPVWPVAMGATTVVEASSEVWNVASLALAGLAVASALLLLGVLARRRRRA